MVWGKEMTQSVQSSKTLKKKQAHLLACWPEKNCVFHLRHIPVVMLDQRESNPNSTSEPKGTSPWHHKAVDMAVQCHCPPDFSEPRMYF